MPWLSPSAAGQPVAEAIGVFVLVCMAGMALGSVKVRGARLGSAGILFAGILAGHFGQPVDARTLAFVKEFGLILFVFTIGLNLGPGLWGGPATAGLRMNALAALIVVLGAVSRRSPDGSRGSIPRRCSASSRGHPINMPSLGAATQTLSTLPGIEPYRAALPALASAVTFPTAILDLARGPAHSEASVPDRPGA